MGSGTSKSRFTRKPVNTGNGYTLETYYQSSQDFSGAQEIRSTLPKNKTKKNAKPTEPESNSLPGIVMNAKKEAALKRKEKDERKRRILSEYPHFEDSLNTAHEGMLEIMSAKKEDMENKKMNSDTKQTLIDTYNMYFDCEQQEHKSVLGDQIAEDNGAQICADYLKTLSEDGKNTPTNGYDAECLYFIRSICWNYSDASLEFAGELGKMGSFPVLITDIITFKERLDEDFIRHTIIRPSISILHNCAKVPENKKYFTTGNALEAIMPYTKAEDHKELKMEAMMTLSYIIEEKDNDKISADGAITSHILMYLENAIEGDGHKYEGFSAYEIVSGIMHLASNDDNKLTIVEKGVLPLLVKLIQEGNDKEKEICAKTVWVLSFRDENKSRIRVQENMMKLLKELADKDGETKESALGALWVLENVERLEKIRSTGKTIPRKKTSTAESAEEEADEAEKEGNEGDNVYQGHVMISYQWGCQKLMLRVKDRLMKMNYRVWIDIESMGGSTLQAMAEAVENSAVVLVCMSPKYKESPNCRTEGEYAYKLGKPLIPIRIDAGYDPDGWLGALQGAKFYVDFSDLMSFEVMFSRLVKELGEKGKGGEGQITPMNVNPKFAKVRRMAWRKPVNRWAKEDVRQWAANNNIRSRKVRNLNGQSLVFLSSMKLTAPEFFFKYSSEKLGLTELVDLISLSRGLENLEI